MTFEKFKKIAGKYRPDAIVHAHKAFGGVPDIAIYFVREDGRHSKVYSYRGTYGSVLSMLGIKVVNENDVSALKGQLRGYKEANGKPGLFTRGKVQDFSKQIAELEDMLARFYSDEFVREWEE